jgi:hypothetical protein
MGWEEPRMNTDQHGSGKRQNSATGGEMGMGAQSGWDLLAACPVADEAEWVRHAEGFAVAFVVPARRERWRELLARRPRRIGEDSHKLHSDLDRRVCRPAPALPATVRGDGLFYGFFDSPRVVPAAQVAAAAGGGDAIFSLVPGELAVYFFHEGEVWLCQAAR